MTNLLPREESDQRSPDKEDENEGQSSGSADENNSNKKDEEEQEQHENESESEHSNDQVEMQAKFPHTEDNEKNSEDGQENNNEENNNNLSNLNVAIPEESNEEDDDSESEESEESEESDEESAKKMKKRTVGIRRSADKENIYRNFTGIERPKTAAHGFQQIPAGKNETCNQRPQTAKNSMLLSRRTFIKLRKGNNSDLNNQKRKNKVDRVARYQTLTKEWGKSKFLSSQNYGAKEGRKLKLANSFRTNSENSFKTKQQRKPGCASYATPTAQRRDNMTFKLRVITE